MTRGLMRRDPGELPAEVTGFVGRQRELAVLDGLLGTARLVTVTGPGGVGKTRVALRAAAKSRGQFADGVCLAELGGLHDPDLLPHTVATCLGLPGQEAGSQADAIVDYLRGRQLLLILDSCEHLIGACAALAEPVLRYAAQVTILATSRQPMNMPGEHCCSVPPLPVPEPDASRSGASRSTAGRGGTGRGGAGWAGRGDAVELFAQRAAAASPGFAVTPANRHDVIQLCGRLDGIPLAIELATVQLRTLTLQQLSSRLEHRFSLLTTGRRGALPHQQTLRATTQWSYDLCSAEEQLLWARLSVFAGSFRLTAAEAVCTGGPLAREDILPTLIGLVDKSVVLRTEEDPERYWLLDTIREFGAERLDELPLDADATQDRHIAYFRAMAGEFSRHAKDDDQLPRFRRLRAEHPDLRAALGYALDRPGRAGEAARLAADLRAYWEISGLLREGKHWLTKILLRFSGPSAERAWLLMTRGVLGTLQGELGEAVADLELSIPMAEQHGEVVACALGHAYLCLAFVFSGRHAEAAATGAAALSASRPSTTSAGWCPSTSTWATCTCSAASSTWPSSDATRGCAVWAPEMDSTRSGGPAATCRPSRPWPCSSRASTPRARPRRAVRWSASTSLATSWARRTASRRSACWRCGSSGASGRPGSWGPRTSCGTGPASGSAAPPSWRNSTSRRSRRRRTRSVRTATPRCSGTAPTARWTSWSSSR